MRKRLVSIFIVVVLVMGSNISFGWMRGTIKNNLGIEYTVYGMRNYPQYFVCYSGFAPETVSAIHNACVTQNNAGAGNLIYRSTQTHNYLPEGCDEGDDVYSHNDGVNRILKKSIGNNGNIAESHIYASTQLGDFTYRIDECDIVFNTWYELGSSGHGLIYDVESTVLHELGHAIGLGHSSEGTVMYEQLNRGQILRQLSLDDISGINAIYQKGVM